ncbi:MAG: hypothetical protein Q9226_000472 [Calogaya cf. arnoldii]
MAAIDCFTQVGDRYTKPSIVTHRVSVGITCPPSENNVTCPLEVEGSIEEAAVLNITTQSPDDIFEAVETTARTFSSSTRGSGPKFTYPVEPGRTGYYGFTVILGCFAGVLGDCIGGDVKPGTSIEACTPMTLTGGTTAGIHTLDGAGALAQSDDISDMTTNPSATTILATEETQESVSASGALRSGVLIFVALSNFLWLHI